MSSERPTAATRLSPEFQAALRALQAHQWDEASSRLSLVVQQEPENAVAWNCVGIVAATKKDFAAAFAAYEKALALQPRLAEAHSNCGNLYRARAMWEQAAACYRRAMESKPELAEAHNGLGTCHLQAGALQAAAECFERAVALQPQRVEAWNNLGNVRVAQGRPEQALPCFERALALSPSAEIQCNLGNALRDVGRQEEAASAYQAAIALNRELPEAWNNLGTIRITQQRFAEALDCFREALRGSPEREEFLLNLSNALIRDEHLEEAAAVLDRLASRAPHHGRHRLRRQSLCPAVFTDHAALEAWREAALAKWNEFAAEAITADIGVLVHEGCEPPFNLQFLDGNVRDLKTAYAQLFEPALPPGTALRNDGPPRVGFVVTRGHEGIFLRSLGPLLQQAADSKAQPEPIDWVIFAPAESVAAMTAGIGSTRVTVQPLCEPLAKKIEQLREAACDVLCYFEIGTDAANYFLPQLRLAKVQCTTWGVQVTSGIKNVDYYLSSHLVETEPAPTHYTESLLLADTLLTYQLPDAADRFRVRAATADSGASAASAREHWGLTNHDHAYVCAQHLGKFHPGFDPLLGAILRQDERAVLLITKDRSGRSAARLSERFHRTLGDVSSRIRFLPRLEAQEYYRLLAAADVLLDPPHFGGVNSTYDGLLLGKPIVTRPTAYHRGRYTTACYARMAMTDCITSSDEGYVSKALQLGTDPDYRRDVSRRIVEQREPLFRDRQAVQEFVRLFVFLLTQARERPDDA